MSESLSFVLQEAREKYGEGFVHVLISWLKAGRILIHKSAQTPPGFRQKLEERAFVKVEDNNFLVMAKALGKDDVVFWPKDQDLVPQVVAKVIGFNGDSLFDGQITRELEQDSLKIFDRASSIFSGSLNLSLEFTKYLFLDRDGVIINYVSYPKYPTQVSLREGIVEVIKEYRKRNHRIVMVTNQSGIARGYSTQEDFRQVQNRTLELLAQQGQWIDACYFATYLANSDVIHTLQYPSLRKPRTGMLAEEAQFWNIDLENSVMIGDNASDVEWAQNAGLGRVFWLENPELKEKSPASMTNVTQVQSLDQILQLI